MIMMATLQSNVLCMILYVLDENLPPSSSNWLFSTNWLRFRGCDVHFYTNPESRPDNLYAYVYTRNGHVQGKSRRHDKARWHSKTKMGKTLGLTPDDCSIVSKKLVNEILIWKTSRIQEWDTISIERKTEACFKQAF